jgi:hypothetical protein
VDDFVTLGTATHTMGGVFASDGPFLTEATVLTVEPASTLCTYTPAASHTRYGNE